MPRYIDIEKVTIPKGFFNKDLGVPDLLERLKTQSIVDVVTREDYEAVIAGQETLQKYIAKIKAEVAREIEQVQKEIVDRMQEFINEWKQYSESTVDYFGGKYDAMETASRIVKSILTDKTAELKKKYLEEANDG